MLLLRPSSLPLGDVVITVFTKPPAHDLVQWMSNTKLPAVVRMPPALDEAGDQARRNKTEAIRVG